MTAAVNGRVLSRGNSGSMYWTWPQILAHASRDTWLRPGDVLGSGTVGTGCILELTPEVAARQLGVQVRVEQSNSGSDYVPNLTTLAAQHYNLVIAVGFLMDGAIKKVAPQFPSVDFAIIHDAPSPSPKNVAGLLF